jgi:hypothetical protein
LAQSFCRIWLVSRIIPLSTFGSTAFCAQYSRNDGLTSRSDTHYWCYHLATICSPCSVDSLCFSQFIFSGFVTDSLYHYSIRRQPGCRCISFRLEWLDQPFLTSAPRSASASPCDRPAVALGAGAGVRRMQGRASGVIVKNNPRSRFASRSLRRRAGRSPSAGVKRSRCSLKRASGPQTSYIGAKVLPFLTSAPRSASAVQAV